MGVLWALREVCRRPLLNSVWMLELICRSWMQKTKTETSVGWEGATFDTSDKEVMLAALSTSSSARMGSSTDMSSSAMANGRPRIPEL